MTGFYCHLIHCLVPEVQGEPRVLRRGVPSQVHGGGQARPVRPRVQGRAACRKRGGVHRVSGSPGRDLNGLPVC